MARLRLFANLREAAGVASADVPGSSVREVLENAVARFGGTFAAGLEPAHVWVNGRQAEGSTPVSPGDEVALIPPVSGGTGVVRSPVGMELALVGLLIAALFGAAAVSLQWLTATAVLVAGVWAFDVADSAARRRLPVAVVPVLMAILGAALAAYRFGIAGLAGATAGGVLVVLAWSVAVPRLRPIESVTASVMLTMVAATGTGALVVLRLGSEDVTNAFLVIAVAGVAAAWAAAQLGVRGFDPVAAALVAMTAAGFVAAAVWGGEEILPIAVAGVGAAVALVAGRNIGSLVRAGGLYTAGSVPGSLSWLDGVFPAAAAFWALVSVLA